MGPVSGKFVSGVVSVNVNSSNYASADIFKSSMAFNLCDFDGADVVSNFDLYTCPKVVVVPAS